MTADVHDRVRILSDAYNYPLRHRAGAGAAQARELDLDEIVHLHYRLWFHMPDALAEGRPAVRPDGERYRWLAERLPLEPEVDDPDRSTLTASSARAELGEVCGGPGGDLGIARVELAGRARGSRARPRGRRRAASIRAATRQQLDSRRASASIASAIASRAAGESPARS